MAGHGGHALASVVVVDRLRGGHHEHGEQDHGHHEHGEQDHDQDGDEHDKEISWPCIRFVTCLRGGMMIIMMMM